MWEFISENKLDENDRSPAEAATEMLGTCGFRCHLSANAWGNVDGGGDDGGDERETSGRVHPLISY
jgi:hypothetical protein